MKKLLATLAALAALPLLFIAFSCHADDRAEKTVKRATEFVEQITDITGYYACTGKAKDKTYDALCVVQKFDESFLVHWYQGNAVTLGVGMMVGDTLVVGWSPFEAADKHPAAIGVTRYRIQPGGKLVGRWSVIPSNGQIGDEELEFLKALPKE